MKYFQFLVLIIFPLSFIYCSPKNNLDNNLDNIMGVWNRTLLDDASGYEPDDGDYRIIGANNKKYAGYLNSLKIVKYDDGEYRVICEGYDTILNSYIEKEQIILEVESKKRGVQGKIGVNFISKDIIYFELLEGETYSFIDYGQEKPYIRARLLFE